MFKVEFCLEKVPLSSILGEKKDLKTKPDHPQSSEKTAIGEEVEPNENVIGTESAMVRVRDTSYSRGCLGRIQKSELLTTIVVRKFPIFAGTPTRSNRDVLHYKRDAYRDFDAFYTQAASRTERGSKGSSVID
ncbi:hypothetical protein VNO77_20009 [Canavalia gladiata]|uniref:Uncharacterized protein n=1 Tax=Canavalia gladiata TaxID=3824 RepID=A0AAN9QQ49_CANGL